MIIILKLLKQIMRHKFAAVAVIFVIAIGGYLGYQYFFGNTESIRYVSAQIKKGTLIVSVSSSGQVSTSNQVDIKAKASGDVIYIGVKSGDNIKAGTLIAQLDATDAQKAVRDAETNLESAKLSLEKLKKPADVLSILQAENSLSQAKESKQKAEYDLKKSYDDGFNAIANAFLDLPTVITGLNDMLFSSNVGLGGGGQWNIDYYADTVKAYDEKVLQYKKDAHDSYQIARAAYNKNFNDYKSANRFSETAVIESLASETYDATKNIAEAIKNANNLIQFYRDKITEHGLKPQVLADTHLSTLSVYTSKTNSHLLDLLNVQNNIKNSRDAIINSDRLIAEKTEFLAKLKAGPDVLDIQSAELTIKQRENALFDAKERLAYYFIRAPFDGVVARLNIKNGDPVSSATALATFITKQKIAEVSLNEVDVTKIKINNKVVITFDAIPDLSIVGQVAEIDTIGTVTQGVVTYTVKIVFNTQDDRVKSGMSVSVSIITDVKQNTLLAPNSAVKQQGDAVYVEIIADDNQAPQRQNVQIGLSNDTMTEITSGLKEGDRIVTQTINQTASQSQTQQNTGLRIPGVTGGSGFSR